MATLSMDTRLGNDATLAKPVKRCNKPLMEKRRRERINVSLNQLKSLVLDALKKDTSQYSKLEKADILEMTVRHLRNTQRQHLNVAAATDATVANKYRAGFSECATEVARYLNSVNGLDYNVRNRVLQHLGDCTQRLNNNNNNNVPTPRDSPPQMSPPISTAQPIAARQVPMATMASALPGATFITSPTAATQQQHTVLANGAPIQGTNLGQYLGAFRIIPAAAVTAQGYPQTQTLVMPVATQQSPSPLSTTDHIHNISPVVEERYCASASPRSTSPSSVRYDVISPSTSPSQSPVSSRASSSSSSSSSSPTPLHVEQQSYSSQYYPSKYYFPLERHPSLLHNRTSTTSPVMAAKETLKEERMWRPW